MPLPLMVSAKLGLSVMLNALAPEANVILATCVLAVMAMLVILEVSNIAVSDGPLGAAGDQFALLFQLPLIGLACHSARIPKALRLLRAEVRNRNAASASKKMRRLDLCKIPVIELVLCEFIFGC